MSRILKILAVECLESGFQHEAENFSISTAILIYFTPAEQKLGKI